jgi:hypothetical protein
MPDKPKDIFEDLEPVKEVPVTQKPAAKPQTVLPKPISDQANQKNLTSNNRWLLAIVGVLVLLVLIALGVIYAKKYKKNSNTNLNSNINTAALVTNANVNSSNLNQSGFQPITELAKDTDKDGLSDVKEAQLGTNLNLADTDGDGLSDGDEVNVFKTNPLKPDTDGDGIIDGTEVKKGYNPNGPGKLLDFSTAKNKLINSNTNQ